MTRVFLKPALDKSVDQAKAATPAYLKVRKPANGHLQPTGEWQNLDSYWQRRINDGDVEVIEGATEEIAEAPAAAAPAPIAATPASAHASDASRKSK